jgi:hypothetical protein
MPKTQKQVNREKLEEIAETTGDLQLSIMLWDMFDDLPISKQKTYLEWANRIKDEILK